MNLPPGVEKIINQLNGQINPLEDLLGSSAAKALAEYTRPMSAAQRVIEDFEHTRKLLGGSAALHAMSESLTATAQFDRAGSIRAALGHSMFANEFATARNAIGSTIGFEASRIAREALHIDSPYVNELQKIQKALQRESVFSSSAQEALRAVLGNNIAKQFASSAMDSNNAAALAAVQSLRPHYSDAISAFQLEAQGPHVLLDAYQRATSWLDPLKDLQQLSSISEIAKYRALASAVDPLRLYQDSLQAAAKNPFGNLTNDSVGRALESLSRFAGEFGLNSGDEDDVDVAPNDIANYSNLARVQLAELTMGPASIEALVAAFMTAYEALPSVRDRKIFATYIYPILIGLVFACINPYSDFTIKQRLEATNHTTEKSVQQTARNSGAPRHVLDSFRFITAQRLTVRVNGRIKSPTIGTLRFGQPVEILKKEGDWTLVHYSDSENEIEVQGWVLSRYLKKYK